MGDNFFDFLFAFLHTMPLLEKDLHVLKKERICSFPFRADSFSEWRQNNFDRAASSEILSIPHN